MKPLRPKIVTVSINCSATVMPDMTASQRGRPASSWNASNAIGESINTVAVVSRGPQ